MLVRLQKYLSENGVCSRRHAEELIKRGEIMVNDQIAQIGQQIDPENDIIEVDGQKIQGVNRVKYYVMLNKPFGYICSTTSEQGASIMDLLTPKNHQGKNAPRLPRMIIVNRLDKDSSGLVLLTNDGEAANRLAHPRFEQEKEYEIILGENFRLSDKRIMEHEMKIGRVRYQGVRFTLIKKNMVRLALTEGKNRELRKIFGALGYNLQSSRCVRIGKIQLGELPLGRWMMIKKI